MGYAQPRGSSHALRKNLVAHVKARGRAERLPPLGSAVQCAAFSSSLSSARRPLAGLRVLGWPKPTHSQHPTSPSAVGAATATGPRHTLLWALNREPGSWVESRSALPFELLCPWQVGTLEPTPCLVAVGERFECPGRGLWGWAALKCHTAKGLVMRCFFLLKPVCLLRRPTVCGLGAP